MTEDAVSETPVSDHPVDEAAAVRKDIERTRAELAETVDALSDKLNVKKQAATKVDEVTTAVKAHPREVAIGGGAVAALVALIVLVRRRRSR